MFELSLGAKALLVFVAALLAGSGIVILALDYFQKAPQSIRAVKRIYFSWFLILVLYVGPLLLGRLPFMIAVAILSIACFREFAKAIELWKHLEFYRVVCLCIVLINLVAYWAWYDLFMTMPLFFACLIFLIPVFQDRAEGMIQTSCLSIFGMLYFGWFLSHLSYLYNFPDPVAHILYLTILVELNDVSAYVCGKLFGKIPLAPNVSPNKTVEGMVGGVLATLILSFALSFAVPVLSRSHLPVLGLLIALGGVGGDLIISFIKRDLQIKDIGYFFPGHGGVLDRFDSLIFVAPIYFHYVDYFFIP